MEQYYLEIRHPGSTSWEHVHPQEWSKTKNWIVAERYGHELLRNSPNSEVRMISEVSGGHRRPIRYWAIPLAH